MQQTRDNEFLWTEKYRPQNIEDCILPTALKKNLKEAIKGGEIQNMLFAGSAGLGKTTVAKAICHMLDLDYLFINASEDSGIDVLRNKIRQFASTMSLQGGYKVVILDEADYLNAASTQPALRSFIEEFSANCRFILTCNFKNKLIEPLHSRLRVIDFNANVKEFATLAAAFMGRMEYILKKEDVTFDPKVLAAIIMQYAPDWRRIIGECQGHSASGSLSPTVLTAQSDESFAELIGYLKDKDFKNMRGWAANNTSLDGVTVFRRIYDGMSDTMVAESIPGAVVVLADYMYKSSFVSDKELNMVACLTELMSGVEWK
jgi:DNA polymerase III delta prime subunit